ncbi:Hypothetical protein NCS54_01444300 [Fusarium falciforme]|uniref:Hypothetical protein n=1 Tax=Fusarium falciforme TaxID=195108 RepID=UPI0022FFE70D|nr:Hypothetical protein NCS54_01444300 [Fusarium falciforme]WAO96759.1 Hypothetical protein NCS54_01444300 [Fusarium falciforme]
MEESFSGMERNSSVISSGIWKLFCVLSNWKTANGLTLELSAHSPSDSEHWFKHHSVSANGDTAGVQEADCSWHDPQHGWVDGRLIKSAPEGAILRLFATTHLSFKQELPRLGGVTCFIIRRQLRRQLSQSSLGLILGKLRRLEHLIYESWRTLEGIHRKKDFEQVIQKHFPQTLRRVSIFEDFNDSLSTVINDTLLALQLPANTSRIGGSKVAAALASKSLNLEHLSVSYMASADDFFKACLPTWTWHRLQSLALTSGLLRRTESRRDIDYLLYKAGSVALQMPRLHTMVIWDGIKGNACAFIYHVNGEGAHITWRSTWEMELTPRVVKAWERVALEIHSPVLRSGRIVSVDDALTRADAAFNAAWHAVHLEEEGSSRLPRLRLALRRARRAQKQAEAAWARAQ